MWWFHLDEKKCSTNLGTSQKYAAHFIKHEKGDDDVGDEC